MSERADSWLPDFCRLPAIFVLMVATQLVVLAIAVAPGSATAWTGGGVLRASAFGQWMALSSAVLLCLARPRLQTLPRLAGALLAWCIPVAMTALSAYLVWVVHVGASVDAVAVAGQPGAAGFVLRCTTLAAMMSAVALRYFYIQGQWQRQVRSQAKAQVDALQARIRPHFLFNSMNTIASLIRSDPPQAERAVEDLSDLFRAALGAGQDDSTLADEIELTRRYLSIEALRLGDRLKQRWSLSDDLPMELAMPRLVLQPLVENAIVHGVAQLNEGGEVAIEISADAGVLRFAVINPVPSRHPSQAVNGHAQESVLARLRYRFGPNVQMQCALVEEGYRCVVSVPVTQSGSGSVVMKGQ